MAASAPTGPLCGITVLDFSSVGPAARCTRLLADYGALVVKIGSVPDPDAAPDEPWFFAYSGHRGMRRVLVDLKDAGGREAFLTLAEGADVVVESFRPGVVDRLGVGYATVKARNPAVIYCSTSGYGQDGPYANRAGHDLNYLAVGGFLAMCTPGQDGAPPVPGATIADAAGGGLQAALAIATALVGRSVSGVGAYLDISVVEGVLSLMSLPIDEHLALDTAPEPGHDILSGRFACYGTYRTRDRRWVSVGAIEAKFFANLCRGLGCPELAPDQLIDAAQPALRSAFAAAFATRDRDEWIDLLGDADACVAPVLDIAEVTDDPQCAARGGVTVAHHPTRGPLRQLAPLLAGMDRPTTVVPLPDPGRTDTEHLLEEAGLPVDTIADLLSRRVVA